MIEHAKEMMGMNIELRKLLDSDKETYFELENETWVNKRMLQDEEANDRSWKAMFADTEAHYAVLMGDQICGFASILKLGEEVQEFGLELFERFRHQGIGYAALVATVYKGNIIKNLIMDCQSYTKYRPNETTGGIFVSWRRKEELPTGA